MVVRLTDITQKIHVLESICTNLTHGFAAPENKLMKEVCRFKPLSSEVVITGLGCHKKICCDKI